MESNLRYAIKALLRCRYGNTVLRPAARAITDHYQTSRAPIWIFRGLLAWLLISPKAELVGFSCAGALNVTRFVVLNDSNRICRYFRSPRVNFFSMEMSRFLVGSRRRLL